jgi:nitrogen fixation/metabolism regulation signal transduction histidine kinase
MAAGLHSGFDRMTLQSHPGGKQGGTWHDLKQPLNVVRLAAENIRVRITPALTDEDALYLNEKLDRIENQICRAVRMIESAASAAT